MVFNIVLSFDFFTLSLPYALALYATGQEQPNLEGPWSTNEETRSTHEGPRATDEGPMSIDEGPRSTDEEPRSTAEGPWSNDQVLVPPMRNRGLPLGTEPANVGL